MGRPSSDPSYKTQSVLHLHFLGDIFISNLAPLNWEPWIPTQIKGPQTPQQKKSVKKEEPKGEGVEKNSNCQHTKQAEDASRDSSKKQKKLKDTVNSKTSQDERVDEKGNLTEGDSQTNLGCSQTELAKSTCGAKPSDSNTDSTQPGESVSLNGRGEDQPFLKTRKTAENIGQHRPVSNNNSKLLENWKHLMIVALVISSPHHATAYEPGCNAHESRRNDYILDSQDVKAARDGYIFDGSSNGYQTVCSNAFHGTDVRDIDLRNNSFQSLPYSIFDYCSHLVRVYLGGNKLTEFPPGLNSSTDIKFLDLSDNQITDIPISTMSGWTCLNALNMSGNKNLAQVPLVTFHLNVRSVDVKMTQVLHPLVPPPQNMVCTYENPCNVTHEEGSVQIRAMKGNKVTYEISPNGTMCEKVKQQLEADYEVSGGAIRCENNVLLGTIENVYRKIKSDAATLNVSKQPTSGTDHPPTSVPTHGGVWVAGALLIIVLGTLIFAVVVKLLKNRKKKYSQCIESNRES